MHDQLHYKIVRILFSQPALIDLLNFSLGQMTCFACILQFTSAYFWNIFATSNVSCNTGCYFWNFYSTQLVKFVVNGHLGNSDSFSFPCLEESTYPCSCPVMPTLHIKMVRFRSIYLLKQKKLNCTFSLLRYWPC